MKKAPSLSAKSFSRFISPNKSRPGEIFHSLSHTEIDFLSKTAKSGLRGSFHPFSDIQFGRYYLLFFFCSLILFAGLASCKRDSGKIRQAEFRVFSGGERLLLDLRAITLMPDGNLLISGEETDAGGTLRKRFRIINSALQEVHSISFEQSPVKNMISSCKVLQNGMLIAYETEYNGTRQAIASRWIMLNNRLEQIGLQVITTESDKIIDNPAIFENQDGSLFLAGMGVADNRVTLERIAPDLRLQSTRKLPPGPVFDKFYRFNVNRFVFLNPLVQDVSMTSYDTTLNLVWVKEFGGSGRDKLEYMQNYFNSFQYALASTASFRPFGESDIWVMKFNQVCDTVRTAFAGSPGKDIPGSIVQTADSGIIMSYYSDMGGPAFNKVVVNRYDSRMNLRWSKSFGGFGFGTFSKILPATNGRYFLVYDDNSFAGGETGSDLVLTVINDRGEVVQ